MKVNIALAAAGMKMKVGILDADIFGPSIPKLMNLKGEPDLTEKGKMMILSFAMANVNKVIDWYH
jgi:ATP-binding protein involved in chromosome partitioning